MCIRDRFELAVAIAASLVLSGAEERQPVAFGTTTQTIAPPTYPPPGGPAYPAPTGAPSFPAPTGGPSFPAPTSAPGFPAPAGAPGFPEPTAPPNFPAQRYLGPPDVLQEPQQVGRLQTTTPLVLVLLLAGVIQMISPVLFALAFALAFGTAKGRRVTIPTFTVMAFVIAFFGVLGVADGSSWELMSTASIGAAWLTLIAVVFSGLSGGSKGTTRR